MEPVFKIMFQGRPYDKQHAVIEMGDRRIIFRAATGEQGPDGPFPFVSRMTKTGEGRWEGEGFCLSMESDFDDLWKLLSR